MITAGNIGAPKREIEITPEREPVPEPIHVPDSPADLPELVPA